jgi:hypothetical protein
MTEDELGKIIVDCPLKVHKALGPGLLESVYVSCLRHEIAERGVKVRSEVPLPVDYDGVKLDCGYRPDLLLGFLINFNVKLIKNGMKRVMNREAICPS